MPNMSTAGSALGEIASTIISRNANKKAKQRQEEALASARAGVLSGYDEAGRQLDVGQSALESGYSNATQQRKDVAGKLGDTAASTFSGVENYWTPWQVPGLQSYQQLNDLLNNPSAYQEAVKHFQASPQYQFQLQQATDQMRRAASAAGNRLGGAQLSALSDRAASVADQGFNQWLDRLQTQANTGFAATTNLSNARSALGGQQMQAEQYGDTSAWDLAKGQALQQLAAQRGDLALNKGYDLANLALKGGTVASNYNLAQGQNLVSFIGNMGELAGKAAANMGGVPVSALGSFKG